MAKVTAIVWAWSSSGRYPLLSSIGIAGSEPRDGSSIFSQRTSSGRTPVGQFGQRARAIASGEFFGGPRYFSLAASASQHATDVKRSKQANSKEDEEELLRLLGV